MPIVLQHVDIHAGRKTKASQSPADAPAGVNRHKPGVLVSVLLITIFIQLTIVAIATGVILAITGRLFFLECLAFIPCIEILTMSIPLTPNGLGIREALSKLMLNFIGLTDEQVGVYVLLGFFSISLKLVGGIPSAFDLLKNRPRNARRT